MGSPCSTGSARGAGGAFIQATQQWLGQFEHVKFEGLQGAGARKTLLMVCIMAAHALGEGSGVGVSFCGDRGWAQVQNPVSAFQASHEVLPVPLRRAAAPDASRCNQQCCCNLRCCCSHDGLAQLSPWHDDWMLPLFLCIRFQNDVLLHLWGCGAPKGGVPRLPSSRASPIPASLRSSEECLVPCVETGPFSGLLLGVVDAVKVFLDECTHPS